MQNPRTEKQTQIRNKYLNALLTAVLALALLDTSSCQPSATNDQPSGTDHGNWGSGRPSGSTSYNLGNASYGPYNQHDGSWAVYWYLCGSDIELRDNVMFTGTGQLMEMMDVTLPDDVTVVVQAGGAKQWHIDIDPSLTNYLVYKGDKLTIDQTGPLSNMGDPQTLADFLDYCNLNYPAEHQALIIYNHGGGSIYGVAFDDLYDMDSLSLPEIGAVMQARPAASGSYEMAGLCCCLMSTIDAVNAFNGYADYLVASQEVALGCEWDFTKVFSAIVDDPDIGGAGLGQICADGYYAQCEQVGYTSYTTLSVIDLAYADELLDAYDAVGVELLQSAVEQGSDYIAAFGRAAYASENYGAGDNPTSAYDMVDLGDLVAHAADLLPNSSAGMLRAIDHAMAYHVKNPMRAEGHGVSCYFPYTGSQRAYDSFRALDTSPGFYYYYEYALTGTLSAAGQDYLAAQSGAPEPAKAEPLKGSSELGLDGLQLTPRSGAYRIDIGGLANSVVEIYAMIGVYDQETGDFVLFGTHNDLERDWNRGTFVDMFAGYWGCLDGALCYMDIVSTGEYFVLYRVPVYHNGEPKLMMVAYTFETSYFVDGSYQILGLVTPNLFDNASNPEFEMLKVGDVIEPVLFRYSYASDYEDISEAPGDPLTHTVVVTADTAFSEIRLADGLYALSFWMIDYSGGDHYTDYGFYQIEDGKIDFYQQ